MDSTIWSEIGEEVFGNGSHGPLEIPLTSPLLGGEILLGHRPLWERLSRDPRLRSGVSETFRGSKLVAIVRDMNRNTNVPIDVENDIGTTFLMEAARFDDIVAVKGLLRLGANPETRTTPQCFAALHFAASNGHGEICTALLNAGADVNARTSSNVTSLMLAAAKGQGEVVRILLHKGANPNAHKRIHFLTALMFACFSSNEKIVSQLLEAGADVHFRAMEKATALHIAAQFGSPCVVEMLLEHGARVNDRDDKYYTPLRIADEAGRNEIADLLKAHGAIDIVRAAREASLLTPLPELKLEIDPLSIISRVPRPIPRPIQAPPPPQPTASENELWQAFLEEEMFGAVKRNDLNALFSTLEEQPDLEAKDHEGNTALTVAVQKGYGEVVETLLTAGADTEVRNSDGERPLHKAAKHGFPHIARALVSAGAKVRVRDKRRRTPMDYAKDAGHWDVVDVLKDS